MSKTRRAPNPQLRHPHLRAQQGQRLQRIVEAHLRRGHPRFAARAATMRAQGALIVTTLRESGVSSSRKRAGTSEIRSARRFVLA